ncbi:MAG: carboxypeptidase regulatory-like domain-containing protein [Thermomicrobiales bacterium]|nr:carboxypeptidase regulatory-like domain-containing protein [Thermomicrobiales bacterium]
MSVHLWSPRANGKRRAITWLHITMLLALVFGSVAPTATAIAQDDPDNGPAWINFEVRMCPPEIDAFTGMAQVDGLSNCTGDGVAGGEDPLVGGSIQLYDSLTDEWQWIELDSSGRAEVEVLAGHTYYATAFLGDIELTSKSVCGSAEYGLSGGIESGIWMGDAENLECDMLVLDPSVPLPASIEIKLAGCPDATDNSQFMVGDGALDCNGDTSSDESQPFAGVKIKFTEVNTGLSYTYTTSDSGYVLADNLPAGTYAASATYDGQELSWSTVCGMTNADGTPLGLAGSVTNNAQKLDSGYSLSCKALAAMPGTTAVSDFISFELKYCPLSRELFGPHVGPSNHVLVCAEDENWMDAVPYEGATITLTGLNTGTTVNITTDANGMAKADNLTADQYAATVAYNGKQLTWLTDCALTDSATQMGGNWSGSISDDGSSQVVTSGQSINCMGLAILPATNADGKTPEATNSFEVSFDVYICDQPLDWSQATGSDAVNSDTIGAVDQYFASNCTTPGTLNGTLSTTSAPDAQGDTTGTGNTGTVGPHFAAKANFGGKIEFKETEPSGDFWLTCTFDTPSTRRGSVLINNDLASASPSWQVTVPQEPDGTNGRCIVFLIPAAGTITHIVHFCATDEVDRNNLTCDEVEIPVGFLSFVGGSVWTDVPQITSANSLDDRVYAGPRWYIRDGFNRAWTYGVTEDGTLVFSGEVPLGELSIGAGNIRKYATDTVLVYCGSPSTGWVDSSVHGVNEMQGEDTSTWNTFSGIASVGVNGAPNDVTCHWFIAMDDFQSPPVVKP